MVKVLRAPTQSVGARYGVKVTRQSVGTRCWVKVTRDIVGTRIIIIKSGHMETAARKISAYCKNPPIIQVKR